MKKYKHRIIPIILSYIFIIPLASTSSPLYSLSPSQVVINEVHANPSDENEWVELYNTTDHQVDIGGCYIDDEIDAGSDPLKIPGGLKIPPKGFYVVESKRVLNNSGDSVSFISQDKKTIIDSYSFGKSKSDESWYRCPDGGAWQIKQTTSTTRRAVNNCGSSVAYNGLEIHHIDVGQADATLIISPSGKTMLIDLGETHAETDKNAITVADYLLKNPRTKSRVIDYLVITHFHLDHVGAIGHGGLWALVNNYDFKIGKTIHRDYINYVGNFGPTGKNWREYLEGDGKSKFHPVIAKEGSEQIDMGQGVTVEIVTTDGNGFLKKGDFSRDKNPPSENDYSVGLKITYGLFNEWIGGDLDGINAVNNYGYTYHDIEHGAAKEIGDVDVLRVNHHGSDNSSNDTFIGQLDPEVSIISVGATNRHEHPKPEIVKKLLETSDLYLTELKEQDSDSFNIRDSGTIIIKTLDGVSYYVNDFKYTASDLVRIDNDKDGYYKEVDPNDNDSSIIPSVNASSDSYKHTIYMK